MCTTVHGYTTFVANRNSEGASVVFLVCVCSSAISGGGKRQSTPLRAWGGGGEDVVVREMRGTEKHF